MRVFGVELWCMHPNRYLIIDCIIFAVVVAVCVPVFAAVPASRVYTGILLGVAVIFVLKLWRFLPSHQRWLEHEARVLTDKLVAERRAVRPPTRLTWVVPGEALTPTRPVPLYYPCPYPSPPPSAPHSYYAAEQRAAGATAGPCIIGHPVLHEPLADVAPSRVTPRQMQALLPPPPLPAPNTPPTHATSMAVPLPRPLYDSPAPPEAALLASSIASRSSLPSRAAATRATPPRASPTASTASRAAFSAAGVTDSASGAYDVWGTLSRPASPLRDARVTPDTPYASMAGYSVAAGLPASHEFADYYTEPASMRTAPGMGAPRRPLLRGASAAGSLFASQGSCGLSWGGDASVPRGGVRRAQSWSGTSSPTYSNVPDRLLWTGLPSLPASRSSSPAAACAPAAYRYA